MGRRWNALQAEKEYLQGQECVRSPINSDKKWQLLGRVLQACHIEYTQSLDCNVYKYVLLYTLELRLRTNIVIDDDLMNQVLKLTGLRTKRAAVEMGLKALLKLKKQEGIRYFRGKLDWEGNLDDIRTNK